MTPTLAQRLDRLERIIALLNALYRCHYAVQVDAILKQIHDA